MVLALIPVKSLATAKSRLAVALGPDERRTLVVAMLERVVAECAACPQIGEIWIVTPDAGIAAIARMHGVSAIIQPEAGLNGSLSAGIEAARSAKAGRILILPADIPLLHRSEIERIVDTASGGCGSAVAPCHKGSGTNALLFPANAPFEPQFGEDSFRRHFRQLAALGLLPRVLYLPGIAADIDEPDDLAMLPQQIRSEWLAPLSSIGASASRETTCR